MGIRVSIWLVAAVVALGGAAGCSNAQPPGIHGIMQPSESPTPIVGGPEPVASPTAEPSPIPISRPSPTPLPVGTPVARQVLAPAKVLPLAALCSYKLTVTADGNFRPLFCRSGALNVLAWKSYVQISASIMSLGRTAKLQAIRTAMCLDMKNLHATKPEEGYGYEISAAYYGWKFDVDPTTFLYEPYDPAHPVC